jgi:hypothetical protein
MLLETSFMIFIVQVSLKTITYDHNMFTLQATDGGGGGDLKNGYI